VVRLSLFLTALAALAGVAPPSARAIEPARTASVERKLQQETEHLAASRFERVGDGTIETVGKNDSTIVPVQFDAAAVYAIVAACGEGCDHVEIALFDPSQNLLHRSPDTSDVVIVRGPAQESGVHGIALSAPGCREARCAVGLVLLKQAMEPRPANSAETRAAPIAPQTAPIPPKTALLPPPTAPSPPRAAPSSSTSTAGVPSNPDPQASRILSELANLGVSVREAIRAREKAAASAIAAPVSTEANVAPGRPSGSNEPRPNVQAATGTTRPAGPSAAPGAASGAAPGASQKRAPAADCRAREQQYYAAARTAGAPATIGPLMSMYQYLQCNCGHPQSPQLPPCPR
jgi:hypothetical protein